MDEGCYPWEQQGGGGRSYEVLTVEHADEDKRRQDAKRLAAAG